GGYFTDECGAVKCWMGEKVSGKCHGEVYLQGLELAVQFLLEILNIENENMILVSNRKDIVEWLSGKEEAGWETRVVSSGVTVVVPPFSKSVSAAAGEDTLRRR
ncbi:hypothetical protein PIB30_102321, partial [Stylosanthes scabra]|nr:hypothetical protein [Stylosanthes scabra]